MTRDGRWLPDIDGYAVRLQDELVAFYPLAEDAPHYMRRDVEPTVISVAELEQVHRSVAGHRWDRGRRAATTPPNACGSAYTYAGPCTLPPGHGGPHVDESCESQA